MTGTREVVEAFLARRGAGDIDGMLELFAEPVDFHTFGSPLVPWIAQPTTLAGVREFFGNLFAGTTPLTADVDLFLVEGEEAVLIGDVRVKVNSTGRSYDSPFALRLTVRDGRIVRHRVFEDSYALHVAVQPETV